MKIKYLLILLIFAILCLQTVSALRNPAADYCLAMGYDYTTQMTPDGEEGLCKLPNGKTVDDWKFLLGEDAQEYSYCEAQGYEQKITKDPKKCEWFLTETCAVCIVDGQEVEVTDLMGLDFRETTCGDGSCGFPETVEKCPQDCAERPMEIPPAYDMIPVLPKKGIPKIVWIIAGAVAGIIFFIWFTRKKKPKRRHK
jgi:putative hemolysin